MKKNLLRIILVFALVIGGVFSAFALTYYSINTGAEGGNTGFGPPNGYVAGSDGTTSVEVGSAAQYIFAGADGLIDPPAPDGGVSGDDVLITLNGVGTDGVWVTFTNTPGIFYYGVSGTTEVAAPIHIYVRVWNTWEVGAAGSYYGNSNIVTAAASTLTPPLPNDLTLASYYTDNPFDFSPPLPPTLEATPEADGDIFLTWQNSNESDFAGTMIRFFAGGSVYPTNETEGTLFINSAGGTGETRSATHESLAWNVTYRYSAFSYDSSSNYSSAATAAATSTDLLPPIVTVYTPNGGETYAGGSVHNITWEATEQGNSGFGANPISIYYTTNSGSSWTFITQEANDGSYAWTVPYVNTTQARVSVEAIDQASNVGMDQSDADFTIDSLSPEVTSIEVRDRSTGNPLRTNEQTVTVEAIGVSAEAVQMRIAQNASFSLNDTGWISFTATTEYTLTGGDGTKEVYYKVRDAVSNESAPVSNSIILDTTGPTGGSITINSGNPYTNEVNVVLSLTATDEWAPLEMIISNEASFAGANWETFAANKAWALTAGDGSKTVYAKFRDGGSNESGSVNDNILLDTIPPTVEVTAPDGGEIWTGGSNHDITWTAVDSGSGFGANPIVIWFTSNEGASWIYITTEANDGTYNWTLPTIDSTQCRISVEATDQALNTGRDKSGATFTIDSTPPSVTSIEARDRSTGNPLRTNERPASVEAFGVSGDAAEMRLAENAAFTVNDSGWISYQAVSEYTLTTGDGSKTVYYKVRDGALQESGTVNNSIILDTTGPTPPTVSINSGDPYTNEVNVALSLTATDEWTPIEMKISNEASYSGATWEAYASSKAWALSPGDGTKTVYAMFRDGGGNTSEATDNILLDTTPPTVEVQSPNGGETWAGGSVHNIQWTASDPGGSGFGSTPITIRFTTDEGATWIFITQEANSSPYAWTVPFVTSTECRVSIEAVDRALNVGTDKSNNTFEIDSTAPIVSTIEVKDRDTGDTERTNERTVSVEAGGVSGSVTHMRMAEDAAFSVNDSGWIAYLNPAAYELTSGDGTKTVYYKLLNSVTSNESSTVSAGIVLDTTGPTLTSITINGGMAITNETGVILTLTATDEWPPIQMIISNEVSFAGGMWEPYAASKNWNLTGPDGTKTLYVKYRDGGYNESSPESDSIILDTTSPEVVDNKPIGINVTLDSTIEVFFSKNMDKGSAQSAFSISPQVTGTFSWVGDTQMIFAPSAPLSRGVTYEVQVSSAAKDLVGNILSPAPFIWQFRTIPDNVPPVISNYLIDDSRPLPESQVTADQKNIILPTPTLTANIQDEGQASRIAVIEVLVNSNVVYHGTPGNWGNADYTIGGVDDGDFELTLDTLAEGTYSIELRAEDFAGNPTDEAYYPLEVYGRLQLIGPVLNYPNPFSPLRGEKTIISYYLSRNATIAIYIYDITAQLVWKKTCIAGQETALGSGIGAGGRFGYNEVVFDGRSSFGETVPNGLYIARIVDVTGNRVLGTGKPTVLD